MKANKSGLGTTTAIKETLKSYLEDTFIFSLGFFTPTLGPAALGAGSVGAIGTRTGSTLGSDTLASGGDSGRVGDSVPATEAGVPASARALGNGGLGRGGEPALSAGRDSGTAAAGVGFGWALGGGDPRRGGGRVSDSVAGRA